MHVCISSPQTLDIDKWYATNSVFEMLFNCYHVGAVYLALISSLDISVSNLLQLGGRSRRVDSCASLALEGLCPE